MKIIFAMLERPALVCSRVPQHNEERRKKNPTKSGEDLITCNPGIETFPYFNMEL